MLARSGIAALIVLSLVAPAGAADLRPVSVRQFRADIVVAEDGTAVQTLYREIAPGNDAAAARDAQQSLVFSDAVGKLELVEAYTQKPDGRRLAVDPRAIRVQLAPGVPNLPQYTDRKQMVAVFPDARGGDLLVSTWRTTITHPIFPGQFAYANFFGRTIPWDSVDVSVTTPADKPLHTEAHGPVLEESVTEDGHHLYRWHYSAPVALAEDPAAVSPLDRAPRLFASTLTDWAEFSREYAAVFAPQAAVTPRIQALADEITSGTSDKREQAAQLYDWVSGHIRWVAIYLGNEPWIPHTAESVLANGYGDCKDQAALLVALLHAKGIAAEPVLINLNPRYQLSDPAVFAFDHCITYLPEWNIYADTTAGGAPFGTVQFAEYGKPLLHVRAEGAPPDRIAPLAPEVATQSLRTTATLGADGLVTGTTVEDGSGPYATALRFFARTVQARGGEQAAAQQLRSLGEPGQGSLTLPAADAFGPSYQIEGKFTLDPHPEWLDGDSFAVPTGLRMLARTGDLLIGPIRERNLPVSEPSPCHAGSSEEELTLGLPPGYRPTHLPKGAQLDGSFFHYESRFAFANGAVQVHRSLVSSSDKPLCTGEQRTEAATALTAIRRDLDARITLEKTE